MGITNAKLNLISAPEVEPVSVDDLKQYLRLDTSADDNLLPGFIQAAREMAETMLWRTLVTTTWELVFDTFPPFGYSSRAAVEYAVNQIPFGSDRGYWLNVSQNLIELPNPPLQSVTSITYLDQSNTWKTLDPSNYVVSVGDPGQIQPKYASIFPITLPGMLSSVKVQFVAGYGDDATALPASVKTAIMLLAAHLYNRRDAVSEKSYTEVPMGVANLLGVAAWGGYR